MPPSRWDGHFVLTVALLKRRTLSSFEQAKIKVLQPLLCALGSLPGLSSRLEIAMGITGVTYVLNRALPPVVVARDSKSLRCPCFPCIPTSSSFSYWYLAWISR